MEAKLRILFVDDEQQILRGMRRMLHSFRDEWSMSYASSGAEALASLESEPVDVVVSDMKMPEMNGAELLLEVKERHPLVIRIILSGYSDEKLVLQSIGAAHQYLIKPCEPEALKQTIRRAQSLNRIHTQDKFRDYIAGLDNLPSMPDLYLEISRELESEDPDLDRIIDRARVDPALTLRILQLVNSGFFGLPQRVVDVSEAIHLLGARVLKSLVLLGGLSVHCTHPGTVNLVERVANHSLKVAELAAALAPTLGLSSKEATEAYTAGVLHDVGKMIFAANLGDRYLKLEALAEEKNYPVSAVEKRILNTHHGELGSYLLRLWGLPDSLAACVNEHCRPQQSPNAGSISLLTAVHLADAMLRVSRPEPTFVASDFDEPYLQSLHLIEEIPNWQAVYDRLSAQSTAKA